MQSKHTTYFRGGKQIKRRAPTKREVAERAAKVKATWRAKAKSKRANGWSDEIASKDKPLSAARDKPSNARSNPAILQYLTQGKKHLMKMIEEDRLEELDPVHKALLRAFREAKAHDH
jgi:hypothetical protein